jgi:aminoglycoside phosphotransferase (APT) family kinase protein
MSNRSEQLRKRVRQIMPSLKSERFVVRDEGLVNDVVIVNNEYVFRFAKSEKGAAVLEGETRILDLIRPHLAVSVPAPIGRGEDFLVYPYLDGVPLTLQSLRAMDQNACIHVAESMGRFLMSLHTTDITHAELDLPITLAPVTYERWQGIYRAVKETVYPLLWEHQVEWAESFFGEALSDPQFFTYESALIHGDLRPQHILIDRHDPEIQGILDFGVAGLGDPASDIGTLINTYGESFAVKMRKTYPRLDEYLPRARFYAQALELHWVLLGIEYKENFWFVAHLGCARDLQP